MNDVLVTAGEAVANAVEHAYVGRLLGEVIVEADLSVDGSSGGSDDEEAVVRLCVRDHGRWRDPSARDDRGRGRKLIDALADRVRSHTGPSGTTVWIEHRVGPSDQGARASTAVDVTEGSG